LTNIPADHAGIGAGPIACVACSALAKRITVAKLYHFDSDRDRLFRKAPVRAGFA
jgi:hypothetical protein